MWVIICNYVYNYIYQELQRPQKNVGPMKKTLFSRKNRVCVKNQYFVFCWICANLSKSGGPVSNFSLLHVAISY